MNGLVRKEKDPDSHELHEKRRTFKDSKGYVCRSPQDEAALLTLLGGGD